MISSGAKRYPLPNESPEGELDPASSQAIILRMVGDGKRVLEIGCANGYISRHLTARGNRVTLVDIDVDGLKEASDPLQEVLAADLDVHSLVDVLQDRRYDVVVVGGILEHLRDPVRVLRDARTFLSDGGFAIVSISNLAHGNVRLSLLRGAFDDARFGPLDNTHLRHFTLRSLRELCLRAGYRIDAVERTKVPLFVESDLVPRVDEGDFSHDVIAAIRHDREHDTLQFVLRARPVPESEHLSLALEELTSAERRLADASMKLARLERLSADFEASQARSAELQSLLGERDAALAREAALAEDLRERLAAAERELAAAREARVDGPGGERSLSAEEFATYRERDEALRESLAEVNRLRAELVEASRSVGEASAWRSEAERAYAALSAQRDLLEETLARRDEELAAARASSAAEGARLAKMEHAIAGLRRELEAHESEREVAGARARRRERELRQIAEERSAALTQLAQEHATALTEARAAAGIAEQALSEARRNAADLASAVRVAEAERDVLAERLARVDDAGDAEAAALDDARAERDALAARLAELEEGALAREDAVAEAAALREAMTARELELIELQHRIESERAEFAQQRAEADESIATLRDSVASASTELLDVQHEIELEREALARQQQIAGETLQTLKLSSAERDAMSERVIEAEAALARLERTLPERENEPSERENVPSEKMRELEAERDALAARLAEAEASVEVLWETVAEREQELLGELRALEAERDALAARLAEAKKVELAREAAAAQTLAKRGEKEAAALATVEKLEAELQRVRSAHRVAVEAFKRHVDTDVKLARAESTEIDGRIRAIQRSWAWSVKMLLVRARRRLPGGRARV